MDVVVPPTRLLPFPVITIDDVPALNVKPVVVCVLNAVPDVVTKVTVLPFREMVLVLVLLDERTPAVTEYPLAEVVKVPCVIVRLLLPKFNASPSVTVIPNPFMDTGPRVLPALVSVPVPVILNVPEYVIVIPAESVMLPATVIVTDPAKVPVNPVQLMDLAPVLPELMVQVPVDRLVKNTSSAVVGTLAPPAPPDVVDHLVPAVPSQFAVPPTQYLSATVYTL